MPGPIQAFVIVFPNVDLFEGRIAEELEHLSDSGQIAIVDAVFVLREGDDLTLLSASDLDSDERTELRAAMFALTGLGLAGADGALAGAIVGASIDPERETLAEAIGHDLAEDLPDGSSALVLAIEHLWAAPLAKAVRSAGGIVLGDKLVTAEKLIALGVALDED